MQCSVLGIVEDGFEGIRNLSHSAHVLGDGDHSFLHGRGRENGVE